MDRKSFNSFMVELLRAPEQVGTEHKEIDAYLVNALERFCDDNLMARMHAGEWLLDGETFAKVTFGRRIVLEKMVRRLATQRKQTWSELTRQAWLITGHMINTVLGKPPSGVYRRLENGVELREDDTHQERSPLYLTHDERAQLEKHAQLDAPDLTDAERSLAESLIRTEVHAIMLTGRDDTPEKIQELVNDSKARNLELVRSLARARASTPVSEPTP